MSITCWQRVPRFFIENILFDFPLGNGAPGSVRLTNPAGDTSSYVRVIPFAPDEKTLAFFAGTYFSEEADVTLQLFVKDGHLQISRDAGILIPLKPVYVNSFVTNSQDLLQFKKTGNSVAGFGWSISRAYNVWFKKIK